MAIPWLHVIREHPSFLEEYEELFATSTAFADAVKAIAKKTRNVAGWLRQMWRALRSDGEPWTASQALSGPVDVLFVSHLLSDADAGKAADFYFGNLPEVIRAEGRRVVVALIDHSATPDMSRAQRWDENASPRVVFSDTLGLQGELSLFRRLRRESSRLATLSRQDASGFLKKVFSRASLEAMSGGARATLRMSVQVSHLVATIKPKMMIVTYEGHAWERMFFVAARQASAGLQCVGYQHAAIFRLQHGALRKLGPRFDPDLILTPGSVSKGQIESSEKARGIPVRVLGSNRAFVGSEGGDSVIGDKGDPSGHATAPGVVCLVLPEGIVSECLLLFEFSLNCAELIPDMCFIWRLHPLVKFDSLIAQNPAFQKLPRNVELSTATIEVDIARAGYALYRGSTAIVNAVRGGAYPIYLERPEEMTIDPLYQLSGERATIVNTADFLNVVRADVSSAHAAAHQQTAEQYCADFYMTINPSALLALLPEKWT